MPLQAGAGYRSWAELGTATGSSPAPGQDANRDEHEQQNAGWKRDGQDIAREREFPVDNVAGRENKNRDECKERTVSP